MRILQPAQLLWLALALLPAVTEGKSMPAADKVFPDPQDARAAAAAMDGDPQRLAALLKAGANPRSVGQRGLTLTHFALLARRNAPQVLQVALDAGADPVSLLVDGGSVPQDAVSRDNADPAVVKVLLDRGISPNWFAPAGPYKTRSLLQSAVMGQNLPVVRLLVQAGADLNYAHPIEGSALHYALDGTSFQIAAFLVDSGIKLDLRDNSSPAIRNANAVSRTAIDKFCHFQGGTRGKDPLPEIAEGWRAFNLALERRGVRMPCGL